MAVFTSLSTQDIAAFLRQYHVGALQSAEGIAEGISNTNFLLTVSNGKGSKRYILTLFEQRITAQELPYCLKLTEWLSDRGIPCPRPQKGRDGGMVYMLKNKPAALVEFLEGKNNPEITTEHLTLVGSLCARLHLAAEGFPMVRRTSMGLDEWETLFCGFRGRAEEIYLGLERLIADELAFLRQHWPETLPSGVIHADIFPDNVFFANGHASELRISGIIDFYYACNDFWLYDLMVCLNAWCFNSAYRMVPERVEALFTAYRQLRPLTAAERKAMPVLARAAAVRFLMTRSHDWLNRREDALVVPKNPLEYVEKLKFLRMTGHWQQFGL